MAGLLKTYRAPDHSAEAAIEATFEALREVEAAVARGEEPKGAYRWVSVYEVNGEEAVRLPADRFNGSRDEHYYGHIDGGYGPLSSDTSRQLP